MSSTMEAILKLLRMVSGPNLSILFIISGLFYIPAQVSSFRIERCRSGYIAMGELCYKPVFEKHDWDNAAILCGADGAYLARYDTDQNHELRTLMTKLDHMYKASIEGQNRFVICNQDQQCAVPCSKENSCPKEERGVSVEYVSGGNREDCEGNVDLVDDGKNIVVKENCRGTFKVKTVTASEYDSASNISPWIGGNTNVLSWGMRAGKAPVDAEPPRLMIPSSQKGCFQASLNQADQLVLQIKQNCKEHHPFICEYENSGHAYNPLDIILIAAESTHKEAMQHCKNLGRSLLQVESVTQLHKAKQLLGQSINRRDGWLQSEFTVDGKDLKWSGSTIFKHWKVEHNHEYGTEEDLCLAMRNKNGYWYSDHCTDIKYPICGPPIDAKPVVFTPPFAVPMATNLGHIRDKLEETKDKYWICPNPVELKCRARNITGHWITNKDQLGRNMQCLKGNISCTRSPFGTQFDCNSMQVKFLCPRIENMCTELKDAGGNSCSGKSCSPVNGHYVCDCPQGVTYSEQQHACYGHCGKCKVGGDPHFITYSDHRFDFMGKCKYKFAGICDQYKDTTNVNFDVYTQNEVCGHFNEQRTCVKVLEVYLRNVPIFQNDTGVTLKKDFTFVVNKDSHGYTLNDKWIEHHVYNASSDAFEAKVKHREFILVVFKLNLKIYMLGDSVTVYAPYRFKGKMCGLCGDCGIGTFNLRNGTRVNPPIVHGRWDKTVMANLAPDWVVDEPGCRPTNTVQMEVQAPEIDFL